VADHVTLLTGTPIVNHPSDALALLKFINVPGLDRFQEKVIDPFTKGDGKLV
jgi:hypothetical protein